MNRVIRFPTSLHTTDIRACGVSLGHVEMIHAETCTAFLCLLIELFGTAPGSDCLTGVAIDRGNIESKEIKPERVYLTKKCLQRIYLKTTNLLFLRICLFVNAFSLSQLQLSL